MTPAEGERYSKMVPEDLKASIGAAIDRHLPPDKRQLFSPALCEAYENDPRARQLLDCAMQIEGLVRQPGVHAAGVVVCDQPLENLLPLYRQSDSPDVITQWDGPTCEKAGLMKMDILGLKTLSVIQRTRELVREKTGNDVDPAALPLDDPAVFELFQKGETDGVFQFESPGMKGALRNIRPTRIEDLIAVNAMYRPGPMELIPLYASRKRGETPVEKIHPRVDDLLAETYGIMVYQEQIMQVLNRLGGFPLGRALSLIKAISKKKEAAINAERPAFLEGAARHGIARDEAERLFELIRRFADYGFNKAHATGYAIVAYQTAWFKVHHPLEFWAATLTFEADNRDKLVQYLADCRRMGIVIAPPDINASAGRFNVDGDRIRFGLLAVKGVGESALEAILAARAAEGPFRGLYDFCRRVDPHAVNRAAIEALIRGGAFDAVENGRRAAMSAGLGGIMEAAQRDARDRAAGQGHLFGFGDDAAGPAVELPRVREWSRDERMRAEKETIGLYVSQHPLDSREAECRALAVPAGFGFADLDSLSEDQEVAVVALIVAVRPITVQKNGVANGRRMARLLLEDRSGRGEAVVFAREYEPNAEWIREDAVVYLAGTIGCWRDRKEIRVSEIRTLADALHRRVRSVEIAIREPDLADSRRLAALSRVLSAHPGDRPVRLRVRSATEHSEYVIELGAPCRVAPAPELIAAVGNLFSPSAVALRCAAPERPNAFPRRRPKVAAV
jgi:DNA polymerase-3 subunit alpha